MGLYIVIGAIALALTGLAGRMLYRDRDAIRQMPASRKWAEALSIIAAIAMFGVFIYFLLRFSDTPITACGAGYCGKSGAVVPEAEYHSYAAWRTALIAVWVVGCMALFWRQLLRRRQALAKGPERT